MRDDGLVLPFTQCFMEAATAGPDHATAAASSSLPAACELLCALQPSAKALASLLTDLKVREIEQGRKTTQLVCKRIM